MYFPEAKNIKPKEDTDVNLRRTIMSMSGKIVLPKTYLKTRMQRKQHTTTYPWQHTATYQGDPAFVTDQQQQLGYVPDYFSFNTMFFLFRANAQQDPISYSI